MRCALFFTFLMMVLPGYSAEDCACPVIDCDPCQKKLFLGSETKQCSSGAKAECEKMVCENVDNYFQCVAKQPAVRLPEFDVSQRYTEPHFPGAPQTTPAQYADNPFMKSSAPALPPMAEPVLDSLPGAEPMALPVRGPASVNAKAEPRLKPPVEKPSKIVVEKIFGRLRSEGVENLKGTSTLKPGHRIWASEKSQFMIRYDKVRVKVTADKGSVLRLLVEDGEIVAQSMGGAHQFVVSESPRWFLFDGGEWRLGKTNGELKTFKSKEETTVHNTAGNLWYRKNELIAATEKFPPGTSFKIHAEDLYSFDRQTASVPQTVYMLNELTPAKEKREPAEGSVCEAPTGQFEQCAWKCFGKGKKDKACATDKANVKCVRFTCSADGQWKMPTFVPGGECVAKGVRTGFCQ